VRKTNCTKSKWTNSKKKKMFRKFVSTVMMVLIASMVFASPPNEKNMTNTNADMLSFAETQTLNMVANYDTTAMTFATKEENANDVITITERSANVAYEMQSDNRRCSSQYNTTMTATIDNKKNTASSPPASVAPNFCSESFSYTTTTMNAGQENSTTPQETTNGLPQLKFI